MSSLEQAITDMRAAQEETNNRFLELIANMSQRIHQLETPAPETLPPKTRSVRPAPPPEFDGERTQGMTFLNSCRTYLRLCPEEFADEQTKIVWAMSYMKSGRAQKWTARIFRWEQQPENVGENKFLDWEDFCTEFKQEFTPAHADTLAINRLESAAYYQKGRPLDDYIDEFQDLITDSGYTDNKVIVVKFRRGLNALIQNAVATMASGRPSDDKPEQWYKVARTVDQNRSANEAFSSSHRTPISAPRPSGTSVFRPPPTSVKPGYSHIAPTPGNPVPMDLDAARKSSSAPVCFRCKQPGHFSRDCPARFDVRKMTTDELQEALEIRMAQQDVVPSDQDPRSEPERSEDFPEDSE